MKVKVVFTVDVDEYDRRMISQYYGDTYLADRQTVRDFFTAHGRSNGRELLADEGRRE